MPKNSTKFYEVGHTVTWFFSNANSVPCAYQTTGQMDKLILLCHYTCLEPGTWKSRKCEALTFLEHPWNSKPWLNLQETSLMNIIKHASINSLAPGIFEQILDK